MGCTCRKHLIKDRIVSVPPVCTRPWVPKKCEWKTGFYSRWKLYIHFKEEPSLGCQPSSPSVLPQQHTASHKCNSTVREIQVPNSTQQSKLARERGMLRFFSILKVNHTEYPNYVNSTFELDEKNRDKLRLEWGDNNTLILCPQGRKGKMSFFSSFFLLLSAAPVLDWLMWKCVGVLDVRGYSQSPSWIVGEHPKFLRVSIKCVYGYMGMHACVSVQALRLCTYW